jgi:hypothetical protein
MEFCRKNISAQFPFFYRIIIISIFFFFFKQTNFSCLNIFKINYQNDPQTYVYFMAAKRFYDVCSKLLSALTDILANKIKFFTNYFENYLSPKRI